MKPDYVPTDLRRNVIQYVRAAAAALGLGDVAVEWHAYTPEVYQAKYYAWFQGHPDLAQLQNVIHINVDGCKDLSPQDLEFTVYHEARHCWQWHTSRFIGSDAEKDADGWAGRALNYVPDKILPYWSRR